MMNVNTFCEKAINIANNYETLYVYGCYGAPLNATNKKRYTQNTAYNRQPKRTQMINSASETTFGFDCVCLIKGILWGWAGNLNKTYGGATYCSNGVPDVGANTMCSKYLKDVSTDFSTIIKGEAVWINGHIGIYVGDGNVVECAPKWLNKAQITHLGNITKYKTGHYRVWTKHGKLPWVDYSSLTTTVPSTSTKKTDLEIAKEVVAGKWGTGATRKKKLTEAGYNPTTIQALVNQLLKK